MNNMSKELNMNRLIATLVTPVGIEKNKYYI